MNDYDSMINYKTFYSGFLESVKITGNEMMAKCPFHDDRHASLSINSDTGQWNCHACGKSGNAQVFLQDLNNISAQEALRLLRKEAGLPERSAPRFDVVEYARIKRLPIDFVQGLQIKDNRKSGISIPYMDESGAVVATRQRFSGDKGLKFSWVRGSKVHLYGLWKLPEIRKREFVILVEGESDAHTLWYYDYPALGVPGASTFQIEWVDHIRGLDVYLFQEPDIGGQTFVRKTSEALMTGRFDGQVYSISINEEKIKDPSQLHISNSDKFLEKWNKVMDSAEKINIREVAIKTEELIPNAPLEARAPDGWRISPLNGISKMNAKGLSVTICPVPVMLSRRLRSIDTGDERIELTFKRDGAWHNVISNRSTIFQTKTVTMLADKGLPITSEKARMFVEYLGDFEAENLDLLPLHKSTEHLGWVTSTKFLPGLADDIVLDIDPSMSFLAEGYSSFGTYDAWKKTIGEARKNHIARFIIASSFAAPLMKLINHRIFIVHNWGDTRSGKTAALKAALSVWGDPDVLISNFNATRVGLERMASFYNDLPLGIDERQVLGDKQGFVDSLIYLLGMGKGKTRGTRTGGIQHMNTWRCAVLTTGEDPLIADNSQGGIRTRVLEVFGRPFNDEANARAVHQICNESFGFAGLDFIKRIIKLKTGNSDMIKSKYEIISKLFSDKFPDNLSPHVSAVSLIALADMLASIWIWGESEKEAFSQAEAMGTLILDSLDTIHTADPGERAWQFIKGWIFANSEKFKSNTPPPRFGFVDGMDLYCVIPSFLEKALSDAGYNYRKTLRDFADKGYISTDIQSGKRVNTCVKRMPGENSVARFVVINPESLNAEKFTDNEIIRLPDDDDLSDSRLPF